MVVFGDAHTVSESVVSSSYIYDGSYSLDSEFDLSSISNDKLNPMSSSNNGLTTSEPYRRKSFTSAIASNMVTPSSALNSNDGSLNEIQGACFSRSQSIIEKEPLPSSPRLKGKGVVKEWDSRSSLKHRNEFDEKSHRGIGGGATKFKPSPRQKQQIALDVDESSVTIDMRHRHNVYTSSSSSSSSSKKRSLSRSSTTSISVRSHKRTSSSSSSSYYYYSSEDNVVAARSVKHKSRSQSSQSSSDVAPLAKGRSSSSISSREPCHINLKSIPVVPQAFQVHQFQPQFFNTYREHIVPPIVTPRGECRRCD